jgi:hypothetical protein
VDTTSIRKSREGVSRPDLDQETPHGCYDGWVFLGFQAEEDGDLVEVTDRVRCRRCQLRSADTSS